MNEPLPPDVRILVIDDDDGILNLVSALLTRIGITPIIASTAEEGLEILEEQFVNLLILDLMLPGISGFDVLERLRADDRFDDLPILILSAIVDPEGISKGLEMGADSYLTKPYLPKNLTSRVRTLLQQGRRRE